MLFTSALGESGMLSKKMADKRCNKREVMMRQRDVMRNHSNSQIQATHSQSKNFFLYYCPKTTRYEASSGIVLHSNLINVVRKGPYRALVLLITAI